MRHQNEGEVCSVCEHDGDCQEPAAYYAEWSIKREEVAKRLCVTHAEQLLARARDRSYIVVAKVHQLEQLPLAL